MSSPFWDNGFNEKTGQVIEAPGYEGALYQANPWDSCLIQNNKIPGSVQVQVQSRKRRCQHNKHNGSDGATPIFRGLDPATLQIRVTIWTPTQLVFWENLLPVLFPTPNKDINKLSALDISHPATLQRGIRSVIIEDIEGPMNGSVNGTKDYVLRCVEYIEVKPTKKATKTVIKSAATTKAFTDDKTKGVAKNAPKSPAKSGEFGPRAKKIAQGGTV